MRVKCPICRDYDITDEARSLLQGCSSGKNAVLSAIVRRSYALTQQPETITEDNFQTLASQGPDKNDIPGKVRYLLGYIAHKSRFPGDEIALNSQTDYPICFAANASELEFYIRYANEAGFLDTKVVVGGISLAKEYRLTTKGWEETKHIPTLESPYAFVAMSFSKRANAEPCLVRLLSRR